MNGNRYSLGMGIVFGKHVAVPSTRSPKLQRRPSRILPAARPPPRAFEVRLQVHAVLMWGGTSRRTASPRERPAIGPRPGGGTSPRENAARASVVAREGAWEALRRRASCAHPRASHPHLRPDVVYGSTNSSVGGGGRVDRRHAVHLCEAGPDRVDGGPRTSNGGSGRRAGAPSADGGSGGSTPPTPAAENAAPRGPSPPSPAPPRGGAHAGARAVSSSGRRPPEGRGSRRRRRR